MSNETKTQVKLSWEHTDFAWVKISDLKNYIFYEFTQPIINKLIKKYEK